MEKDGTMSKLLPLYFAFIAESLCLMLTIRMTQHVLIVKLFLSDTNAFHSSHAVSTHSVRTSHRDSFKLEIGELRVEEWPEDEGEGEEVGVGES